jgi:succinoglycan biosynthesis transport protein ExoP
MFPAVGTGYVTWGVDRCGVKVNVLRRRWKVIAVVTGCALVGTIAGLTTGGSSYVATTTLQVPATSASPGSPPSLDYADRLANTYKRIAEGDSLRAEVERRLPSAVDVDVSLRPEPNTELLELNAEASDPGVARRAVEAWASALVRRVRSRAENAQDARRTELSAQLQALRDGLAVLGARRAAAERRDRPVAGAIAERIRLGELRYQALAQREATLLATDDSDTLRIVDPARRSRESSGVGALPAIGLGLFLGLAAGTGVALLLERRTPQLDTLEEIEEATGASVLATIPSLPHGSSAVLNSGSPGQHAFGALRARILSSDPQSTPRSILVTSCNDGDGKSLVAVNLAAALARADRRVLLIDGDLRTPCLHHRFRLANRRGLSDLLTQNTVSGGASLSSRTSSTGIANLYLLPSGPPSGDATELLAAPRLGKVLERAKIDHDFVVVDSPALAAASDAAAVGAEVDVLMFVVGGKPVSDESAQVARRALAGIGAPRVGVIVNRWDDERVGPS